MRDVQETSPPVKKLTFSASKSSTFNSTFKHPRQAITVPALLADLFAGSESAPNAHHNQV
jgi:hypothetical protein